MTQKKFYTCRNDKAFKEIFMNEKNEEILRALLESILHTKIEKIEYLNLEKNVDGMEVKKKHFDLHVKTKTKNIQIEVNNHPGKYVHPRNMAYLCHTYGHEVLVGEGYNEDTIFIQINFTYSLSIEEKPCRIYQVQDDTGKKYVNNLFIYDFNMEYYKKMWYSMSEEEKDNNKYIAMMDFNLEELKVLSLKDRVVNKYMEEIERVNNLSPVYQLITPEEDEEKIRNSLRREYREEGLEEGRKEGLEIGREEGREEGIKEAAIQFLNNGVSEEVVAKSLNMTIEEVKELKTS